MMPVELVRIVPPETSYEEHEKLRRLMLMYKQKAAYNADMASRYHAAQTRLRKFEG